jgi:hypothetical protein
MALRALFVQYFSPLMFRMTGTIRYPAFGQNLIKYFSVGFLEQSGRAEVQRILYRTDVEPD